MQLKVSLNTETCRPQVKPIKKTKRQAGTPSLQGTSCGEDLTGTRFVGGVFRTAKHRAEQGSLFTFGGMEWVQYLVKTSFAVSVRLKCVPPVEQVRSYFRSLKTRLQIYTMRYIQECS